MAQASSTPSGYFQAPFGTLVIYDDGDVLQRIDFCEEPIAPPRPTPLTFEVIRQLRQYVSDPSFQFDLPLSMEGTHFQKLVWAQLSAIPNGQVRRYGQLAHDLESSARAIGMACRRNPIPLVVPCHRVVAANGLGGFAGKRDGLMMKIKRWLLEHEKSPQ